MKKETDSKNKTRCGGELSSGPAKHESFLMYTSLRNNITCLSLKEIGMLFVAILDYADGKEKCAIEKNLSNSTKIAFSFVSNQMDVNFEKYDKICEQKRKAANKRWGKSEDDARASSALHNENENENEENENENENEKKEEINSSSSSSSSNNDSDSVAKKEDEEEEKNFSEIFKKAEETWMPWFNSLLKMNGSAIPPLKMMTPKRAKKLCRLARKYGNEKAQEVFRRAVQTPFLNGKGKKSTFVASFDWLLEEKNFLNVYEGNFYG